MISDFSEESMILKIIKMAAATLLLLLLLQYLVKVFTTLSFFIASIFIEPNADLITLLQGLSSLLSIGLIVYLWVAGFKRVFTKSRVVDNIDKEASKN